MGPPAPLTHQVVLVPFDVPAGGPREEGGQHVHVLPGELAPLPGPGRLGQAGEGPAPADLGPGRPPGQPGLGLQPGGGRPRPRQRPAAPGVEGGHGPGHEGPQPGLLAEEAGQGLRIATGLRAGGEQPVDRRLQVVEHRVGSHEDSQHRGCDSTGTDSTGRGDGQAAWQVPAEAGYRNTRSSTKDHERRWIEVSPKPDSAVRWDGDG